MDFITKAISVYYKLNFNNQSCNPNTIKPNLT
jgi:hypothetical protein